MIRPISEPEISNRLNGWRGTNTEEAVFDFLEMRFILRKKNMWHDKSLQKRFLDYRQKHKVK